MLADDGVSGGERGADVGTNVVKLDVRMPPTGIPVVRVAFCKSLSEDDDSTEDDAVQEAMMNESINQRSVFAPSNAAAIRFVKSLSVPAFTVNPNQSTFRARTNNQLHRRVSLKIVQEVG